jgi:uncharacterized protein involved in outer membrane biogenesis
MMVARRRTVSRLVKVTLIIVVVVAALAGGALFVIGRYVQSASFREAVLAAARQSLGADVEIGAMHVSVLRGVTLEKVAVRNPAGLPGNLLTAERLVLRYRLWPLLRRRLELDVATLDRPFLRLVQGPGGQWNYERLGQRPPPVPGAAPPAVPSAALPPVAAPGSAVGGFDVHLPRIRVQGGEFTLLNERGHTRLAAQGLDVDTALEWAAAALTSSGTARVSRLSIGPTFQLRDLLTPVTFAGRELRLSPIQAQVAEGRLDGEATLRLDREPRYATRLSVKGADLEQLLSEGGARRRLLSGKLRAEARLEGTGAPPAATGEGWVEVIDGAFLDLPALQLLGAMLHVPALRDLRFKEARVEFRLEGETLRTPVVRVVAPDLRITGQGAMSVPAGILDHHLMLHVTRQLHGRLPRDTRAAFAEQPDGTMALPFRVFGPYDAPRTDLGGKLFERSAEDLLRKGLKQLIR